MPFNTCLQYEIPESDAETIWQAFIDAQAFITHRDGRPFIFAVQQQSSAPGAIAQEGPTLKVDADFLWRQPDIRASLVDLVSDHPCVQEADALSFAPNGPGEFTRALGRKLGKRIINLWRPEGARRSDIRYGSESDDGTIDRELVQAVGSVSLIEDVSSTGFSAHCAAATLLSENAGLIVHSPSLLLRGSIDPRYQQGPKAVTYHPLLRRSVPWGVEAFRAQFPNIPVREVS